MTGDNSAAAAAWTVCWPFVAGQHVLAARVGQPAWTAIGPRDTRKQGTDIIPVDGVCRTGPEKHYGRISNTVPTPPKPPISVTPR